MNPQTPQPKHQEPLPPMTGKSWLKLIIGLLVIAGIITAVVVGIGALTAPAREYSAEIQAKRDNILANGIEATATSTGGVSQDRELSGRRYYTVYHAKYTYVKDGLDYPVTGEKDYKSADNIKAGMTAKIKYIASDPLNVVFISEE